MYYLDKLFLLFSWYFFRPAIFIHPMLVFLHCCTFSSLWNGETVYLLIAGVNVRRILSPFQLWWDFLACPLNYHYYHHHTYNLVLIKWLNYIYIRSYLCTTSQCFTTFTQFSGFQIWALSISILLNLHIWFCLKCAPHRSSAFSPSSLKWRC